MWVSQHDRCGCTLARIGEKILGGQSSKKERVYQAFLMLVGIAAFVGVLTLLNYFGIDPLR